MAKNHYLVLGVDRAASPEEIKAAYRRQVKQLHPDYYGQDCNPFIALQEAYDVLSDPDRRRRYDEQLAREQSRQADPHRVEPRSVRGTRPPAEPLIPVEEPLGAGFFEAPWPDYHSWIETLFEPIWADFDRLLWSRFGRDQFFEVELSLTQAQARRGGRVRLLIPVEVNCRACHGRGRVSWYECDYCAGRGVRVQEYSLWLTFPAGLTDGEVARVPLDRLGLARQYLVVHFRID